MNKSEDKWKSSYMSAWGYSRCLNLFEDTLQWDKNMNFGLPSSKKGSHKYTPHELRDILCAGDPDRTIGHLLYLFSLFDFFIAEVRRWGKVNKLKGFRDFNINQILNGAQTEEFGLARETRNCYVHHKSKISKKWIEDYKKARGIDFPAPIGSDLYDNIPEVFHQIEDWHELILNTMNKIKSKIETILN
jgi:hypothetical protein